MYFYKNTTVFCLIVLFLSVFVSSCKQTEKEEKETQPTSNVIEKPIKVPGFLLYTLEDKPVSIDDYKGKYVIIHIATTWCPFCNAEAPHLEKLYQDYKERNVEVMLIDVKESVELVREKLKDKYNLTFPILLDINGNVAASFAPKDVLPDLARDEVMLASNILIDPEGYIQFMSLLDSKNFDAELIQLKNKLDELL
ncbi:TlpA family protein disulfide reductase [Confluentibacter flavum]|uniref:Thioredoxin domain-containing protein n=1 Tax=Confluentibacter flavum TaxID=1909700 RepID=A0A2N3HI49_9FLAO|nr:TlpA family protein disulfide reductase [Confluentibacter flavum]PKQ44573.1 hypothetical protein CSW08_12485 [Confluentibacter flavum]